LDEDKKGRGERKKGGKETGDKGDIGNRKREAGVWNRGMEQGGKEDGRREDGGRKSLSEIPWEYS
jgi:hypothetical protein